ncbi:C2 domain [Trinorchestia longiramus]|nr:C2 domain [Trinorchestia longiramus]
MEARKLKSRSSGACNPYVKLSLVPDEVERTFCRTSVLRSTTCPRFDQQFSFDFLPEDLDKRLLISLWNRDPLKKKSEFLGCMSFNVGHILSKRVQGWFRLLTETVGRRKHFAAPPPSPHRPPVQAVATRRQYWLQQDGISCHVTAPCLQFLEFKFSDRLISCQTDKHWPPYSLDLSSLYFFSLAIDHIVKYQPSTLSELKRIVEDFAVNISEEHVRKMTSDAKKRAELYR